ncbi:MAG TPA: hypothetical protein VL651_11990 [Bacteroidia bacterium]|jgi:hypothetical protein|nr:hypothetical protein [Bacteroidia bacterium]
MSTDEMRKEIRQYLETAEERLLKAVHAMLKEYSDSENKYELSEADIQLLEERRAEYKKGKGKTYSPKEIRKMIHSKHSK